MKNRTVRIQVDDNGHLVLPAELMRRFGLVPGASVLLSESENEISLSRSTASLKKVYIEPTNICNLDCRTCMRNAWDEPLGAMSMETFSRALQGITQFSPIPNVFFGGFGEPLSHPNIIEMVSAAKKAGAVVEIITNGILLSEGLARQLLAAKVDRLWVSIDGATSESYTDIRLGAELPGVIRNLARFNEIQAESRATRLGIAFVAMRRNLADLVEVLQLGKQLGADRFSISNVLPHTKELNKERLFSRSMSDANLQPSPWSPVVSLPRMDLDADLTGQVMEIVKNGYAVEIDGKVLNQGENRCPFISKGSISIRWDGAVSPCLPLLHTHQSYLGESIRKSSSLSLGNIQDRSLVEIWNDPTAVELRERVQSFDFSPCTLCNSCDMAEANMEDCFGNVTPACGGCLWAQGFIQCP